MTARDELRKALDNWRMRTGYDSSERIARERHLERAAEALLAEPPPDPDAKLRELLRWLREREAMVGFTAEYRQACGHTAKRGELMLAAPAAQAVVMAPPTRSEPFVIDAGPPPDLTRRVEQLEKRVAHIWAYRFGWKEP